MIVQSSLFGEIEVQEENIIFFEDGIPGFNEEKQFVLIVDSPFSFLQSVRNKELVFLMVDPFLYYQNYEFDIPTPVIERLAINSNEDVLTYTIVVIKEPLLDSTTNLQAPIIINLRNKQAKQLVINDIRYRTKQLLFENKELVKG